MMNTYKLIFRKIATGAVIGLATGAIICLFRLLTAKCDTALNQFIFPRLHSDRIFILLLWGVGLFVLACIVYVILRAEPSARGGGVGHAVQEANGTSDSRWWSVVIAKLASAPLCLLAGLSFGKTGPAIELGSMMGKGVGKMLHIPSGESTSEMIYSGAAAGLAALFNAPAAGALFAIEKLHRTFDWSFITILTSSATASAMSILVFGHTPIVDASLPLTDWSLYACFAILGIVLGVAGHFYAFSLSFSQKILADNKRIPVLGLWCSVFFTAGIIGYFVPELTGGGSNLLARITQPDMSIRVLLLLLIGKYLFSMLSSGSGLPGGTVFPLLSVGGCLGQLFGMTFSFPGTTFLLPGMAGFFASVMGLPFTGILLLCEFSCRYQNFLPLCITCLFSYLAKRIICFTVHRMK